MEKKNKRIAKNIGLRRMMGILLSVAMAVHILPVDGFAVMASENAVTMDESMSSAQDKETDEETENSTVSENETDEDAGNSGSETGTDEETGNDGTEKETDEETGSSEQETETEAKAETESEETAEAAASSVSEEFMNLTPGETYWFDLSGVDIPGNVNTSLPDTKRNWVSFTYAGTVSAYRRESAGVSTEGNVSPYTHSLFIADYALNRDVSWDKLNDAGLVFGKEYSAGGVSYTLRAPSAGSSSTGSGDDTRGVPQTNEWDAVLDKGVEIKNKVYYSYGQDTASDDGQKRVYRGGSSSVRGMGEMGFETYSYFAGLRPVLEVSDSQGAGGLRSVEIDFGGGRMGTGDIGSVKIAAGAGSEFTAPDMDILFLENSRAVSWRGSDGNTYRAGDTVPASINKLTAQWETAGEEFTNLTPGETYWFDLSGETFPGTVSASLPDTELKWVPFTYAGTVFAYKRTYAGISTDENVEPYDHSLFIAKRDVSLGVSWDRLDSAKLIFGKDYQAGGVSYTLRAPSAGSKSNGKENGGMRGVPLSNEWDAMLDKGITIVGERRFVWGQDSCATSYDGKEKRVMRVDTSSYSYMARNLIASTASDGNFSAFRPVLEIKDAAALGADGLRTVELDFDGGQLGESGIGSAKIAVKSGEGFTVPDMEHLFSQGKSPVSWKGDDGNTYQAGDTVPASVNRLTTQWEEISEQFDGLVPGETYWFDLSGVDIPGNVNTSLPDTGLHWVPFTYAGMVYAYKLAECEVSREDEVKPYDHSLFIADYAVSSSVRWGPMNGAGLFSGKDYKAGGISYVLRAPSAGSKSNGESGEALRGVPLSNEWDKILDKGIEIKNAGPQNSCWGQDYTKYLYDGASANACVTRWVGESGRGLYGVELSDTVPPCFRPVLEIKNAVALGRDGLRTVEIDLNGGKLGDVSDAVKLAVKNGESFAAPAGDGIIRPEGDTGTYFAWADEDGGVYQPGDTVPASAKKLTARWKAGDISKAVVSMSATEFTYNGTKQVPDISLAMGGKTLTKDTDYRITCSDPVGAGTVTATITGMGDYEGTIVRTYEIKKAKLHIGAVTAQDRAYDGTNQVEITAVTLSGVAGSDDVAVNISGLQGTISGSDAGEYKTVTLPELALTGNNSGNYTLVQPETAVPADVTISPLAAVITVGTNAYTKTFGDAAFTLDITDNNAEADVQYGVAEGQDVISVKDGTVTILGAGEAKIKVSLPASANYTTADDKTITVIINKKSGYAVDTLERGYFCQGRETDSIDLAALLPKDCGDVSYGTPVVSGAVAYSASPVVDGGKLSYTLENGNAEDEGTITVAIETRNYADITVTVKVTLTSHISVKLKEGAEVTLKNNTLTYGESLSELAFNGAVFVDGGGKTVEGQLAWKDAGAKPDAGTVSAAWIFTPKEAKYAPLEGVATITVKQAVPAVSAVPTAADRRYDPSKTLADVALSGGAATGVDGEKLEGAWSWQNAGLAPSVTGSGYAAVFTPDDSTNYETVTRTVTLRVEKAKPYIAGLPAAAGITYGQTLENSALSGGTVLYGDGAGQAGSDVGNDTAVAGTFAWKDSSARPAVADSGETGFAVVFTPLDTANYNPAEATVKLTVSKAQNAPNMPGSAMNVSNSVTRVGDVPLPEGWAWRDSDRETELESGVSADAVAVYTGEDRGSYETETVTVTVTRSACDHAAGDILYTGTGERAPACTEDGLGHRECGKCGSVVESGITVPALGHHYRSSETRKPTTTVEGIMTYICTRCGHSYTRPIAKLSDTTDNQPEDSRNTQKPENTKKPESVQKPGNNNAEPKKTVTETGKPFIKDDSGKQGWDVIREEVGNAENGKVVTVDMNGAVVVPGKVLDDIRGKSVTVAFDMGNGVVWSVDGTEVTEDKVGDIDFSVQVGTNRIPAEVIDNLAGGREHLQISLAYNGDFGFTAVLSIDLGRENAGFGADLYYYNEASGDSELTSTSEIAGDGVAEFAFTHASDYIIVINKDSEQSVSKTGVSEKSETTQPENDADPTDARRDWLWRERWVVVIIGALAVVMGIGMVFVLKKKKEPEE